MFPFSSSHSARSATPRRIPIVPKKSGTKNVNSHGRYSGFSAPRISILKTISVTDAGKLIIVSGTVVIPSGMPSKVTTRMETIMLPRNFRTSNSISTTKPSTNKNTFGEFKLPNAKELEFPATTTSPVFNPISAIKRPIPALIENLTLAGIALTTNSRRPTKEIITNKIPLKKINPKATSTGIPASPKIELTIATELIPGARQNGLLVYSAMAMLQTEIIIISTVRTAPLGSPALLSILGTVAST